MIWRFLWFDDINTGGKRQSPQSIWPRGPPTSSIINSGRRANTKVSSKDLHIINSVRISFSNSNFHITSFNVLIEPARAD